MYGIPLTKLSDYTFLKTKVRLDPFLLHSNNFEVRNEILRSSQ